MGKAKKRTGLSRRSREVSREQTCTVADLPALESLHDVPAFEDMGADAVQAAAFEAWVADAARRDEQAASEMHLGVVVRLDRGFPLVACADQTLRAEHAVGFAKTRSDEQVLLPAVGDRVVVRISAGHDMGVIEHVLPRHSSFERWRGKALGSVRDTLELVCDRIARSMVLALDCGVEPVIVLTKADRCDDAELERVVRTVRQLVGPQVRVLVTSSVAGQGVDEVRACVPAGSCAMILGESGAGKSTLLNALLGHEALETGDVRERDDAGRHTTVARVMVSLGHDAGVIADAPGLRSLPLVGHERGLAKMFPEIV